MPRWRRVLRILLVIATGLILVCVAGLELLYQSLLPVVPDGPIVADLPRVVRAGLWIDITGSPEEQRMPFLYPFLLSALLQGDSCALRLAWSVGRMELSHVVSSGVLTPERAIKYQLRSMAYATWVARHWTPDQAIQTYSTRVWMADDVVGLPNASVHYFGVPLNALSVAQAAMLVGQMQSPNPLHPGCHPDRALARRTHILSRLREGGVISAEIEREANEEPLGTDVECRH